MLVQRWRLASPTTTCLRGGLQAGKVERDRKQQCHSPRVCWVKDQWRSVSDMVGNEPNYEPEKCHAPSLTAGAGRRIVESADFRSSGGPVGGYAGRCGRDG